MLEEVPVVEDAGVALAKPALHADVHAGADLLELDALCCHAGGRGWSWGLAVRVAGRRDAGLRVVHRADDLAVAHHRRDAQHVTRGDVHRYGLSVEGELVDELAGARAVLLVAVGSERQHTRRARLGLGSVR